MTGEANSADHKSITSTIVFGVLGAGLVYYGRRTNPGIIATLATTIGAGFITKAVSSTVFAALAL